MRTMFMLLCLCIGSIIFSQTFADLQYSPTPIEARVPAYTVKADLSNVSNRKILPKLTAEQMKVLVANGFVARTTSEEQLFYVCENNAYRQIGSFVTTDSVLHTYHIFYDYTLRYMEKERLLPALKKLSRQMLQETLDAMQEEQEVDISTALQRNAVFFAVPLVLLGETPTLPDEVQNLVNAEVARIMAHQRKDFCITGAKIDYTQFIPRGHYTRSAEFEQYFRAMMWCGLVPMPLERAGDFQKMPTLQALIITEQLQGSEEARALWQQIYDPTVFYVGKADDLSFYEYGPLLERVFGKGTLERFADDARLASFAEAVKKELAIPGIAVNGSEEQQFRFVGQRYIPDSRILQEVSFPRVGTEMEPRAFPMGLDVFAVLGSERAAQLLDVLYKQPQYVNYLAQREKMRKEFSALSAQDWQQNLYFGWMYCLQTLLQPKGTGYPSFMRNTAWLDKTLVTALGSWTELRHDTILYAKQSGAECGEGGDAPPPVISYVEPEVEVYERLSWLIKFNKAGLLQRGLMKSDDELAVHFDQFTELTDFLAAASRKELRNEALSHDELRVLEHYGGTLEMLMLSISSLGQEGMVGSWWEIENKTDRSMALVADVHTFSGSVLEEAVGNAAEIWVIVPVNGKLYLTRGATFSYYEFHHEAKDRMTDEAWQQRLLKRATPPMPEWVKSYLLEPGITKPVPQYQLGPQESGC